ncbi:uncharacterized protein LOC18432362 isoform X1 [Amborella trichopoda]|uniref:Uncharacterized protein n=1 Tax=Amborella trichopoda TaxID=13333 RepID=W1P975_AMBTC|nr:uncharacterized protein LOC18432362 isoform X1 [Amborella trichopoda]ERN04209.1 hypothetical protein AMTR_s00077p00122770 [Amborella trichopoda]|eukprot:XP_006842534.1 uncharacterized protein LOC18432362 isoform X1 [Amborella trichopoda]
MATVARVRLVYCPNCHHLLPELPNIPVYQCGGCGTTLQAKNGALPALTSSKAIEDNSTQNQSIVCPIKNGSNASSKVLTICSDEASTSGSEHVSDRLDPHKEIGWSKTNGDSGFPSSPDVINHRGKEAAFENGELCPRNKAETPQDNSKQMRNGENKEISSPPQRAQTRNGEQQEASPKRNPSIVSPHRRALGYRSQYMGSREKLKGLETYGNHEDTFECMSNSNASRPSSGSSFGDQKVYLSRKAFLKQDGGFYGSPRNGRELSNSDSFQSWGNGSSPNWSLDGSEPPMYEMHDHEGRNFDKFYPMPDQVPFRRDGFSRGQQTEPMYRDEGPSNYVEDHIHDGFFRPRMHRGKPAHVDNRGILAYEADQDSLFHAGSYFGSDKIFSNHRGAHQDMYWPHGFEHEPPHYSPNYAIAEGPRFYRHPHGARVNGKMSPWPYGLSQMPPGYSYMDMDRESPNAHAHSPIPNPMCSCLHCYNENWQNPGQIVCSHGCCRAGSHNMHSHPYGPSPMDSPFHVHSHNMHPWEHNMHSKEKRLMEFEPANSHYKEKGNMKRGMGSKGEACHCRPIASGAPFVTCYKCLRLLQLPENFHVSRKKHYKLKCGACSRVLSFSLEEGGKMVPKPAKSESSQGELGSISRGSATCSDTSKPMPVNEDHLQEEPTSVSEDYDNSVGKNYSTESKTAFPSSFPYPQDNPNERKHLASDSPKLIKDRIDTTNEPREVPRGGKQSLGTPVPGSPLHEHFGYSSPSELLRKTDSERKSLEHSDRHKDSEPEESPDTTEISEESDDPSKKSSKGGDASIGGFIKKKLRDLGQGLESMKLKVSVNGKPIPDSLVTKAEEKAGSIQAGNYWYDYQAGFWGVMGKPCLGIIPPFIEEFHHPLSKDCAGGKTGVLVNGRELHQIDLDLLADRGLPTTESKAYMIDIDGHVIDELSGEELKSLGNLAPTVNREGRGFGMRVPKHWM